MKKPLLIALLAATLLAVPSLSLGFVLDDYLMLAKAQGAVMQTGDYSFFTFATGHPEDLSSLITRGPYPWWTLPELRLSFMRPFASALFRLDFWAFGETAWLYHVHSLLWALGLIGAVWLLYRKVLTAPIAGLAVILFAIDDTHGLPTSWIANRNALTAALPAVLGLVAWLRYREEGWAPGRWLALVGLGCAFLSGESTFGVIAYLGAFELLKSQTWKQRIVALLPVLALVVVWAIIYRSLGYGSFGSSTYVDPGKNPIEFLKNAPTRISALAGALTMGLTSDLWLVLPATRPVLVLTGLVGCALVALALRGSWPALEARDRQSLKWLTLGSLLALAPVSSTFPTDRLLLTASLGASALFAALLNAAWKQKSIASRLIVAWVVVVHIMVPPVSWMIGASILKGWSARGRDAVLNAPESERTGRVVLITAPDPAPPLYGTLFLRSAKRTEPERWWTLSMDPNAHRVTRVGPRSLELESIGGHMFETVFEQLIRSSDFPLNSGQSVQLDGARITVLDSTNGLVTRIRADFELPLEAHTLLIWRAGRFEKIEPPAEGTPLEIPRQETLMEAGLR